jgi:hypothetical protein
MVKRQLNNRPLQMVLIDARLRSATLGRGAACARFMAAILLGLLALTDLSFAADGDEPAREYRIKAAYLYNLSKFIEWPEEKTLSNETPFTICVYGHNPFADSLEKLREHTVKGRSIAIRYVPESQPIDSCQLLFLSRDNAALPKALSTAGTNAPILSVGDDKNFLANGGLVCLTTENNNVLLDINLTRAKQIGFNISANLLEIAHKIQ